MTKFLRNLSNRFWVSGPTQKLDQRKNNIFFSMAANTTTCNDSANLNDVNASRKTNQFAKDTAQQSQRKQQKFDARKECQCKIIFLDHTHISLVVPKKALAHVIYDQVFDYLDLDERDYFGLQYTDHYHVHHWLDPLKKIYKQVPIGPPYTFRFCVKFYSSEPNNLREELTRYQFFLQLKNDIQTGILPCLRSTAIELAALALQSEFGDYNSKEHNEAFVSEFRFHPHQDEELECAILEYFRSPNCRGLNPAQAELNFLNRVKWLELYGVDMHIVEGRDGNEYRLGLTPTGMLVFDGEQKIGLFFWEKIQRLDFRNKKLTLIVEEDVEQPNFDQIQLHTFVFELSSHKACKHLWKCAIEHHTFFRLKYHRQPKRAIGQLFRLGSTFKYRGRTEYENVHCEVPKNLKKARLNGSLSFERRSSQRYVPRQSHMQKEKFREEIRQQIAVTAVATSSENLTANFQPIETTTTLPYSIAVENIQINSNVVNDRILSSSASTSGSTSSSMTTSGYNSTILNSSSASNARNGVVNKNLKPNGISNVLIGEKKSQPTPLNNTNLQLPHITTIKINNTGTNEDGAPLPITPFANSVLSSINTKAPYKIDKVENVNEKPSNLSLNNTDMVKEGVDSNNLGDGENNNLKKLINNFKHVTSAT